MRGDTFSLIIIYLQIVLLLMFISSFRAKGDLKNNTSIQKNDLPEDLNKNEKSSVFAYLGLAIPLTAIIHFAILYCPLPKVLQNEVFRSYHQILQNEYPTYAFRNNLMRACSDKGYINGYEYQYLLHAWDVDVDEVVKKKGVFEVTPGSSPKLEKNLCEYVKSPQFEIDNFKQSS